MKRFPILAILVIGSLLPSLAGCGGQQAYTAGGRVTLAGPPGTGVSDVSLFLLPSSTRVKTDIDGNWSASLKGTVKVVPAGLGWTFAPASIDVRSDQLVADFAATANMATATAVAAGGWHTLALMSDGKVFSWGNATYGQPGVGGVANRIVLPVQAADLAGISAVSAGGLHGVALKSDRSLMSWGYGLNGELGNGAYQHQVAPVAVNALTDVTAIAAGWSHTLALKIDGTVWAWGRNNYGQLGNNSTTNANDPVQVIPPVGVTFTAIAAGGYHSLALGSDGNVYAWGYNSYGQLGTGDTTNRKTPVVISDLSAAGVSSLAAGAYHSAAIDSGGSVHVWGRNNYGQLGDGLTANRNAPYQLAGLGVVSKIVAGGYHTLALAGATLYAWGNNQYGQLGVTTAPETYSADPVTVNDSGLFSIVAAGYWHSAALGGGSIYIWGRNNYGQLGNGTTDNVLTPTALVP